MNNQPEIKQLIIRAMSGKTTRQVADASDIPEQTIRNIINGEQEPKLGTFIAIVNACGHYLKLENKPPINPV